jgi:predicted kinase
MALYGQVLTARTSAELRDRARRALAAGWPTIIDAAFLRRAERADAATLAREMRVPFAILDCRADLALLRERVAARQARRADASEADVEVLEHLHAVQEPLAEDERASVIVADSARAPDGAALAAAWLERR